MLMDDRLAEAFDFEFGEPDRSNLVSCPRIFPATDRAADARKALREKLFADSCVEFIGTEHGSRRNPTIVGKRVCTSLATDRRYSRGIPPEGVFQQAARTGRLFEA